VALLAAVPVPDPAVRRRRAGVLAPGELPSALAVPAGCPYHPRCPIARDRCRHEAPPLAAPLLAAPLLAAPLLAIPAGGGTHRAACWYPGELPPPAPDDGTFSAPGRSI
jgi:oligopeptide/dipeptide ABC transporter ATP-binding protein